VSADAVDGLPGERRVNWPGIARTLLAPLAAVAVLAGGLWYWQSRDGVSVGDDPRYGVVELPAGRNATGRGPAPELGRAGPDFLLERLGGGTLRLSDLQGRAVLINFWASWCPPCREEMPELVDAYERHQGEGLVVVGVNLQEADGKVREFTEDFGVEFPIVIDRYGEVADVWRLGGPIKGLPSSYFIDRAGVVADVYYGPLREDSLKERLIEILREADG
jgi:peroxiredoxin